MTALLSSLLRLPVDVDVVVPRTESGYHPVCAVCRRTCLPVVSARPAANRLAMTEMFWVLRMCEATGPALAVVGDPDRLLAKVNTPAERDELEALLTHEL